MYTMNDLLILLLAGHTARVWLLGFLIVASVLDYVTTKMALKTNPLAVEANPVMRFIIDKFGIKGVAVMKVVYISGLLVTGIYTPNTVLIILNVVLWAIVFNNYRLIKH